MAGILSGIYSTFIQRNAIFLGTIFAGAFATEIAFDVGANAVWDKVNQGRQWKDIKARYMEAAEDDE